MTPDAVVGHAMFALGALWMLLAVLAAGLCKAAARGDRAAERWQR